MARSAAAGVIVGVVAVLLLSFSGPQLFAGPHAANASEVTPSVSPQAAPPLNPFFTGMAARVALGAPNLTSTWLGHAANASSFGGDPELGCVSPSGAIWVPVFGASRVLEFTPPFTSGENASVVVGQWTFTGTGTGLNASSLYEAAACATDSHGDLWVSDFQNNRILEFVPPFTTGMAASLVLGQDSMTTGSANTNATALSRPTGLSFDSEGNLWVADAGNNRVLEFMPPFSTGMPASLVLGQSNFTLSGAGLTASNLSYPLDVVVSGGVVWVGDYSNARVVGFSSPFSSGEGATYLLGQSSFAGTGATGPGATHGPGSVSADARGDLWVSDTSNRVLEFLPPFTNFETPAIAIGQTNLTGTTAGSNATSLNQPIGALVAPSGALWVFDASNVRALEYVPSTYTVAFTAPGLPSPFGLNATVGGTTYHGIGGNLSVTEENGTYAWSTPVIPGYELSPNSGNVSVNGHDVSVSITVTHVTYTVTFSALGLSAGTNWTVILGGVTHNSPNNGTISFSEANGTYPYTASTVSGYNITPRVGSVQVNGAEKDVSIGFAAIPSSTSSSSSSGFSTTDAVLFIVLAAVVGLLVGLLVGRRRKGGTTTTAAPWSPPAGTAGTPPSGASGPATPPPPGAGGPPPDSTR